MIETSINSCCLTLWREKRAVFNDNLKFEIKTIYNYRAIPAQKHLTLNLKWMSQSLKKRKKEKDRREMFNIMKHEALTGLC